MQKEYGNVHDRFIGIVCGLKQEADAISRHLETLPVKTGISGADASRAEHIAAEFCADGAAALLSVGISGGLDPAFSPGRLVLSRRVMTCAGETYEGMPGFPYDHICLQNTEKPGAGQYRNSVVNHDREYIADCSVLGVDSVVDSVDRKSRLYEQYGAVALDMESHACARAACRAGVPFLCMRVIADTAGCILPPVISGSVRPDGSVRIFHICAGILRHPGQIANLVRLAGNTAVAMKVLKKKVTPLIADLCRNIPIKEDVSSFIRKEE